MTEKAPLHFKIEQLALCPADPDRAIALLTKMGLADWARDHVVASGRVRNAGGSNEADLAFNYQGTAGMLIEEDGSLEVDPHVKPLELEVLHYTEGPNWMAKHEPSASHLGMHCSAEELLRWRKFFEDEGFQEAQSVRTISHTNPVIKETRRYNYVIYDTRAVLGIDVKFIVRLPK